LIYHFGIYNPLFDVLSVGNGRAKQILCFHNITPAHLVSENARALIGRSFRQLDGFKSVQRFWADSSVNEELLVERGVDRRRIEVIPLAVDRPELTNLESKLNKRLEFLFVGRAVKSKGLLDAIQAFGSLVESGISARLSVAGNLAFSDQSYIEKCKSLVPRLHLDNDVLFLGTVENEQLSALYRKSHILIMPSYHEGFCVPIIEGLRGGCIPVGYSEANLPYIANGFGKLVATGNTCALGDALGVIAEGLRSARTNVHAAKLALDRGATTIPEFDQATKDYVRQFEFERVAEMTIARVKELLIHSM
jgi:glycosyltransferase involved in cell wall biosynthesis